VPGVAGWPMAGLGKSIKIGVFLGKT
jgi:hypothetical protein